MDTKMKLKTSVEAIFLAAKDLKCSDVAGASYRISKGTKIRFTKVKAETYRMVWRAGDEKFDAIQNWGDTLSSYYFTYVGTNSGHPATRIFK